MKNGELYKKVTSRTNIYNAIYALESYIFERGLLSDEDIKLYSDLSDKFNFDIINPFINKCKDRLEEILTSPTTLFSAKVYFKLKKFTAASESEQERVDFRPIHSTDLITQVCIVALLNMLMFDDLYPEDAAIKNTPQKPSRKLSGLSTLIPSNFYGNTPSVYPKSIFSKWKDKYKEFSTKIAENFYAYQQTNLYSYEVSLDIKEFFPNVNPLYIYNFIISKLATIYNSEIEQKCLKRIVSKLLYFKIENIDSLPVAKMYYSDIASGGFDPTSFYTKGLPQGLPQAFLFGNIYMIGVSQIYDEVFRGEALYYVDDSVIYTNEDEAKFEENIRVVNDKLSKMSQNEDSIKSIEDVILKYCDPYKYLVEIHGSDSKSSCTPINEAHIGLANLRNLARLTSNVNNAIYLSIDDTEDITTRHKVNAVLLEIDRAIENANYASTNSQEHYRKMLVRYKKFFLFREKLLQEPKDLMKLNNFKKKYDITNKTDFMHAYDNDIFCADLHMLVGYNTGDYNECIDYINQIEITFCSTCKNDPSAYMYFSKDLNGSKKFFDLDVSPYATLKSWANKAYSLRAKQNELSTIARIKNILDCEMQFDKLSVINSHSFCKFIFEVSNSYKRKIANAIISKVLFVSVSDDKRFFKNSHRSLSYLELRLLIYLRNSSAQMSHFKTFANAILAEAEDGVGTESIDNRIWEITTIVISKVREPEKVDSIIQIHKLVNGLWKNGSKFMHFYTLHNEEHSIELIKNVIRLVNTIDYFSIKQTDYYILFLACYLHDISMVIHPNIDSFRADNKDTDKIYSEWIDSIMSKKNHLNILPKSEIKGIISDYFNKVFSYFEAMVRNGHAKDSADFIKARSSSSYFKFIDAAILQVVADVSQAHGYSCNEVYGRKSAAKADIYSLKYMMILLRFADLLDMSKDRVNYYLLKENIRHMSSISKFHWISHYITDSCNIKATYNDGAGTLNAGTLVERLNFEISVGVEQLTKTKPCCCEFANSNLDAANKNITITVGGSEPIIRTCVGKCNMLCRWMMEKHTYLFEELHSLNKYLETVNKGLFRTEVVVSIKYNNNRTIDNEFTDAVIAYLNN